LNPALICRGCQRVVVLLARSFTQAIGMSDEEQKRKEQFAALKRHLEQEQARVDREMPGAIAKEKSDAVVAKLSESLRVNREKKVIESRTAVLRGKKLQRAQNQPDRDYSGGGFYYEESEILHLFVDHTFHYEKRNFSSVSGRGVSLPPSERTRTEEGSWAVEIIEGGAPRLVLRINGAVFQSWRTRDGGVGVHYLDDQRWERYKM
jgi:hypothetical protein